MMEPCRDLTRTSAEISGARLPSSTEVTRTRTLDELVEDAGDLRNRVALFGADASDIHHWLIERRLDEKAE